MDVIKAATKLRDLMIQHERTVGIIATLDEYITSTRKQMLCCDLDLYICNQAHQVSIAAGVKQMYEHYRQMKIRQVQKLSRFIISSIDPDQADTDQTRTDNHLPVTMDTVASHMTRNHLVHSRVD